MKKLLIAPVIILLYLSISSSSHASYIPETCTPIYGGGITCQTSDKFTLNKKVLNPDSISEKGTAQFVDNLSINDPKYSPSQIVKFELKVVNTENKTLNNLKLTDILPTQTAFISGPGSFDSNSNTITIKIDKLNPKESKKYIVEAKIKDAQSINIDEGIICTVNQATLTKDRDESRDISQFCIVTKNTATYPKGGFPVQSSPKMSQTPSTGAGLIGLIALIPIGGAGIILRRKISIKK